MLGLLTVSMDFPVAESDSVESDSYVVAGVVFLLKTKQQQCSMKIPDSRDLIFRLKWSSRIWNCAVFSFAAFS